MWFDTTYEDISVQRRDNGVAVVTLDLPQRRNMMSDAMTASWREVMGEIAGDDGVRCVVVTGAGTAFCSGGDLSWIGAEGAAPVDRLRRRMSAFYRSWLSITELEVPTIAAVNGAAIGAGLALAHACDIRYVATTAKLGVPFARLGMHPGMLTTWSLPRVAGVAVARDLLLTGRLVTGEEAVRLGLASRAVEADEVLTVALEAAEAIAASAPVATRLTKVALSGDGHASYAAALEWEAMAQGVTLATADVQEGLASQRERRPPDFTGT